MIMAIDPGSKLSAYVIFNDEEVILEKGKIKNEEIFQKIDTLNPIYVFGAVVIEKIASYGMAVGEEVFETVTWTGRFMQHAINKSIEVERVPRREVKIHFCHSMKAKDGNIRQALIDRFGPPGVKKMPGKLYGVRADEWQALALAVYYMDMDKLKGNIYNQVNQEKGYGKKETIDNQGAP